MRQSFLGMEMHRTPVAFDLSPRGGGARSGFRTKVLAKLRIHDGFPGL